MTSPNSRLRRAWALGLLLLPGPAAAAGGGLEIFPDPSRLLPLLLLFLVLIPLLDRVLFRPLHRVLDERSARIEGARRKAAEVAAQADQLLGRYESALAEARAEADAERKGRLAEARREHAEAVGEARGAAERELEATRQEVLGAVEAARAALRAETAPLARQVAERLLGRRLA